MVRLLVSACQVPEMLGTASGTRTSRRAGSPITGPGPVGRGGWADAPWAVMAAASATAAAPVRRANLSLFCSVFLTDVPVSLI